MVGVSGDRQEMTIPAMQKLAKDYKTNAAKDSATLGHWVGMATHDVGQHAVIQSEWQNLAALMRCK